MIESMWTNHKPPVSPHSLDLDEMFNFLREDKAEQKAAEPEKAEALDAINQQFEQLDKLWTETEKVRTRPFFFSSLSMLLSSVTPLPSFPLLC